MEKKDAVLNAQVAFILVLLVRVALSIVVENILESVYLAQLPNTKILILKDHVASILLAVLFERYQIVTRLLKSNFLGIEHKNRAAVDFLNHELEDWRQLIQS